MLLHKSSLVGLLLLVFNVLGRVGDLFSSIGLELMLAPFEEKVLKLLALLWGICYQIQW